MDGSPVGEMSLGDILEESDAREVKRRLPGTRPRRESRLRRLLRPEPMFWGLFSAGGFVAALLLPITVAILGIAFAAGWLPADALSYRRVADLVEHPLAKLYLLGLVSLPLFHWAHRFRYAVHHQLGVRGMRGLVAVTCYGTAIVGAAIAALLLLRI
ncbi:MAG: fumarate reductase subunit D [Actinobacteria bacterium]|nr:fumarate reductase subunit D [Actinomycetota bacterium]